MRSILSVLALLGTVASGAAQTPPDLASRPPADPADVASPEAVVDALYETVTRRPGEPFGMERMRTLFLPTARLIPNVEQTGGTFVTFSADEYAALVDSLTVVGGPQDRGFQEEELARRVEVYGDVAHVFSTYRKGYFGLDELLGRGVNAIQMVRAEGRWWVTHMAWDEENGAGPLPARYLESGGR